MYSFANDYSEGACKQVLDALVKTNYEQAIGYGLDEHSFKAAEMIKERIQHQDVDIHFIPGGTPANVLAICLLKSYEAVICCENGHINTHETGAVESTGHKIIQTKAYDGKIRAIDIDEVVLNHPDEHMVKPKMVFISNSSEFGTIYSKEELTAISNVCKKHNLYLYLDGARIASALTSSKNDLTFKDICDLTDIFYIGGTKNGALLGEAMVIKNDDLKENFRYLLKQKGSMLAKGKLLGIQFEELFKDDVYFDLARNANARAQELKEVFLKYGIKEYIQSYTNQIFVILDNELLHQLEKNYVMSNWCKYDDKSTVVRFVCSWATKPEVITEFETYLKTILNK